MCRNREWDLFTNGNNDRGILAKNLINELRASSWSTFVHWKQSVEKIPALGYLTIALPFTPCHFQVHRFSTSQVVYNSVAELDFRESSSFWLFTVEVFWIRVSSHHTLHERPVVRCLGNTQATPLGCISRPRYLFTTSCSCDFVHNLPWYWSFWSVLNHW